MCPTLKIFLPQLGEHLGCQKMYVTLQRLAMAELDVVNEPDMLLRQPPSSFTMFLHWYHNLLWFICFDFLSNAFIHMFFG